MRETTNNVDENAVTLVDLGEVGVTWAVATSTVQFGATICVDQSEGARRTTAMSHLGFEETGPCDWRGAEH